MSTEELLTSLHNFSKGPKESHTAIQATNIFLFLSLTTCISSLISFLILKKKNQMTVLQTLTIFREISFFHQFILFFLVFIQIFQLVYLFSPKAPPQVFLLPDVILTVVSNYLTILSSMMVILILCYSVNLIWEIPKLFEIGSIILKREHLFRLGMLAYGAWFSFSNHLDSVTYRNTFEKSITFSFNPFDAILTIISSLFLSRYMLDFYRNHQQQRRPALGNRVFILISILITVKLLSMIINLIGVICFEFVENPDPPTFFEVIRMTEGLILGAVYVNFKANYVIYRK